VRQLRATVTLLNGDYEFDVCAIHGGLVRYCTECGFATVWNGRKRAALREDLCRRWSGSWNHRRERQSWLNTRAGIEEQESLTQPFTGYVAPLETVKLEPRAVHVGAQAELHVEARVEDRGNLRAERHVEVRAESEGGRRRQRRRRG